MYLMHLVLEQKENITSVSPAFGQWVKSRGAFTDFSVCGISSSWRVFIVKTFQYFICHVNLS